MAILDELVRLSHRVHCVAPHNLLFFFEETGRWVLLPVESSEDSVFEVKTVGMLVESLVYLFAEQGFLYVGRHKERA